MTDFDFCKNPNCRVPRYVEGFTEDDYFKMGWVKEHFVRRDASGAFFERTEHLCPDCRKKELDEERKHEEEWQKLRAASLRNDPILYERIMRERAS